MKRVYVQEQWCLGCHLCEYACAFANSGQEQPGAGGLDMSRALQGRAINPRIKISALQFPAVIVKTRFVRKAALPALSALKTAWCILTRTNAWAVTPAFWSALTAR